MNQTFPFSTLEVKHKKTSPTELKMLNELEKKVHDILDQSITLLNNRFLPLREKFSPKVSVIQNILDIQPEKKYKDKHLENNGFINSHLCINAQTEIAHTEHDSSYTVIAVPPQISTSLATNGKYCLARFELVINSYTSIVIPMYPGVMFSYSGYMLTHRQQLNRNRCNNEIFTNVVSYNSKRLFSNLMESFRREIKQDKKTLSMPK